MAVFFFQFGKYPFFLTGCISRRVFRPALKKKIIIIMCNKSPPQGFLGFGMRFFVGVFEAEKLKIFTFRPPRVRKQERGNVALQDDIPW